MVYRRLADLVVVIHAVACLFFLCGGLLALALPWLALLHLPIAAWVCTSYLCGWTCPLTPVEKRLRRAAGDPVYQGGFVDHYTARLFGLAPPTFDGPPAAKTAAVRRREVILGILFSIWTVVIYAGNYQRFAETFDRNGPPSRARGT